MRRVLAGLAFATAVAAGLAGCVPPPAPVEPPTTTTTLPPPPAREWDCSITAKPGLETVLYSGPIDVPTPTRATPATADRFDYVAVGNAAFTGTGFPTTGELRYGLVNASGEFLIMGQPAALYPYPAVDPPFPTGVLSVSAATSGIGLVASPGFAGPWRWAVVANDEPFVTPPTSSVPVCSSAPFIIPACPDTPNGDGTCPYHSANPPQPLVDPPVWTCQVSATPTPHPPAGTPVEVDATFNGTLSGIPVARIGDSLGNIGISGGSAIFGARFSVGVTPGTWLVGVYQDPWSSTPVCTTTVTVAP